MTRRKRSLQDSDDHVKFSKKTRTVPDEKRPSSQAPGGSMRKEIVQTDLHLVTSGSCHATSSHAKPPETTSLSTDSSVAVPPSVRPKQVVTGKEPCRQSLVLSSNSNVEVASAGDNHDSNVKNIMDKRNESLDMTKSNGHDEESRGIEASSEPKSTDTTSSCVTGDQGKSNRRLAWLIWVIIVSLLGYWGMVLYKLPMDTLPWRACHLDLEAAHDEIWRLHQELSHGQEVANISQLAVSHLQAELDEQRRASNSSKLEINRLQNELSDQLQHLNNCQGGLEREKTAITLLHDELRSHQDESAVRHEQSLAAREEVAGLQTALAQEKAFVEEYISQLEQIRQHNSELQNTLIHQQQVALHALDALGTQSAIRFNKVKRKLSRVQRELGLQKEVAVEAVDYVANMAALSHLHETTITHKSDSFDNLTPEQQCPAVQ